MGRTDEALARAEQASINRKSEQKSTLHAKKETGIAGQDANAFADISARLRSLCEEKNQFSFVIAPLAGKGDLFPMVMELANTINLFSNLRILVVDANMTTPCQASLQGGKLRKGLTDILAGEEVFLSTLNDKNKLHFLPCGTSKHRDTTIFHSAQFADAMQLFKQRFDMLIILASPVIGHIDTQLISLKTDGLVMVIDSGKTRQPVSKRAMEELHNRGVKVLGTILNGRKYYIPQFLYKWI